MCRFFSRKSAVISNRVFPALDFSTPRLVFLISKAFHCSLISHEKLGRVPPFFENFNYLPYKGVPYKPYWVYCSSTVRPRIRTSKNLDKMSPNYQYLFNGLTPKVNQRHLLSFCRSNFVPELKWVHLITLTVFPPLFISIFSNPLQKKLFQLLIYLLKGLNWEFGSLEALYDVILLSRVLNNTWIFVTGVYEIGIVKGCTKRVKIDQKPDTKLVLNQFVFAYIHPVWAVVILAKVWTLIITPIKVIIS